MRSRGIHPLVMMGIMILFSQGMALTEVIISPDTIDEDFIGYVYITADCTPGEELLFQAYIDVNKNGAIDAYDRMYSAHYVTDGQAPRLSNTNIPYDIDLAADGNITLEMKMLHPPNFLGQMLFNVTDSCQNEAMGVLVVEPADMGMRIDCQVQHENSGVPGGFAMLMPASLDEPLRVSVGDQAGNLSMYPPAAGSYYIIGIGFDDYYSDFYSSMQSVDIFDGETIGDVVLDLLQADSQMTIVIRQTGKNGSFVGVNFMAQQGEQPVLSFGLSGTNNRARLNATPGYWGVEVSLDSLASYGMVAMQDFLEVNVEPGQTTSTDLEVRQFQCTVLGRITDAESNEPVIGITVSASPGIKQSAGYSEGISDLNGCYCIGLLGESYIIQLDEEKLYQLGYLAPDPYFVDLQDTCVLTGIDFSLQKYNSAIQGTVTLEGEPIQGIIVHAEHQMGMEYSTSSASDGYYHILVEPGILNISPVPGYMEEFPYVIPQRVEVEVSDGETQTVDFDLKNIESFLKGTVYLDDQPLPGITLFGYREDYFNITSSDADGNYSLGLFAEEWVAGLPGDLIEQNNWVPADVMYQFDIDADEVKYHDFKVYTANSGIAGRVIGDDNTSLVGIGVYVVNIEKQYTLAMQSGQYGWYNFDSIAGDHLIFIDNEEAIARGYFPYEGSRETLHAGFIKYLEIVLEKGTCTLEGRVTDALTGQGISRASVIAAKTDPLRIVETKTGPNGYYQLPTKPGIWLVEAVAAGYHPATPQTVTFLFDGQTKTRDFQLTPEGRPYIRVAGYWDSMITTANGGTLSVVAYAEDINGASDIQSIELYYQGIPTGVHLKDDGTSGDTVPGDGLFWLIIQVDPGAPPGIYPLEMLATDLLLNKSDLWPYLVATD